MSRFWSDIYFEHFQRHFKKPFDVQTFHDANGFGLKLATYDLALANRRVYASIGLADKLADQDEEDFGEAFLVTDGPDPVVPATFVHTLFFILQHAIPLGSRFAIGGVEHTQPAFAKRHGKSALYFALARDESERFNKVRRGDEFGRVYQAFFITPEEDDYLNEYGPDEFEKLFDKLNHKQDSLGRRSCV